MSTESNSVNASGMAGHPIEAPRKDYGYRQRIITLNSFLYIREDTGPNLEEASLCFEDGEPDTFTLANFPSLKMMRAFIEIWDHTHPDSKAIFPTDDDKL